MAQGKELKFQFVLDDQSFQRVRRALGELTTEAQKFARAMQGGSGLMGGNVGRGLPSFGQTIGKMFGTGQTRNTGIGSAILGDIDAFSKLAKTGKDGMAAMTTAVRAAVRDQISEIDRLDAKMARLHERFKKDPRAAYEGPFRANLQKQMIQRQSQLDSANDQLANLTQAKDSLAPPGAKPGLFGFTNPLANVPFAPTTAGGWMRAGGMVVGGGLAALSESMGGTRTYSGQETARSALVNTEIRRLRGADVTGMLALKGLLRDSERAKDLTDQTGFGAKTEALSNAIFATARNIASKATGGLVEPGTPGQGMLTPLSTAARNSGMMENVLSQKNQYEGSTDFLPIKMATERFYGDLSSRRTAGRILGVGLSLDKRGIPRDSYGNLDASLTSSGYDVGQYASAFAQARNSAGMDFARKNSYGIMAAQAAGYGGYGEMMAAAARAGSPLSGLLALGGGNIATQAGISLGAGVLGSGFDVRGTTGGAGILSAAQGPGFNFTGGAGDFNQVQQILAGMGLGSTITGGGLDSYQAGRNIINAIGVNPGGTTYAQDYLGTGMNLRQMMDAAGGDLTKTAKALGLTSGMARQQLSGSMSSVMDRFVDQGGSDPMSKAIRGYRASGQSVDSYLNSLYSSGRREEADAIGAYFGMVSGEGEEAGLGLAGLLGGVDTKGRAGRGPAGGRGQMERAVDETRAKAIKEDVVQMETIFHDMRSALELAPASARAFREAGTNLDKGADDFLRTLKNLTAAVDDAAFRLSQGKIGEQIKATPPSNPKNFSGSKY